MLRLCKKLYKTFIMIMLLSGTGMSWADESSLPICTESGLSGRALGWCEGYCGDHQCGILGGKVSQDANAVVPAKVCESFRSKLTTYLGPTAKYPCDIVKLGPVETLLNSLQASVPAPGFDPQPLAAGSYVVTSCSITSTGARAFIAATDGRPVIQPAFIFYSNSDTSVQVNIHIDNSFAYINLIKPTQITPEEFTAWCNANPASVFTIKP